MSNSPVRFSTRGTVAVITLANPPVNGSFDVYEVFAETRIPLVQDAPFAKNLTMELAFRYSF
mgnify:CR=1 FL=1